MERNLMVAGFGGQGRDDAGEVPGGGGLRQHGQECDVFPVLRRGSSGAARPTAMWSSPMTTSAPAGGSHG